MGILRILLAFSVVVAHGGPMFGSRLVSDVAVNSFFVVSGFYMALILDRKYSRSHPALFFSNRALRLYPTYLVILAFVLFSEAMRWYFRREPNGPLGHWVHEAAGLSPWLIAWMLVSNLTFFGADALVYHVISPAVGGGQPETALDFQILRQTWSLGTEVVFYLFAPLMAGLRLWILVAVCVGCTWARWIHLGSFSAPPQAWWEAFFLCRFPLFLLGIVAYRWQGLVAAKKWNAGGLGWGAVILMMVLALLFDPLHLSPILFYLAIGALAPFLFQFSNSHRWDRFVGEMSYSMYLLHWIVLYYTSQISRFIPAWGFTFFSACVALGGAFVVWRVVEHPIDRFRQRRIAEKKGGN